MNHNHHWFFRFVIGPLSALILCTFIEIVARYGPPSYTLSLALPVAALALSAWYGGLWANLLSALIVSLYAVMAIGDLSRVSQVAFTAFVIAVPTGLIKRQFFKKIIEQQRASDTIDANISRLINTLDLINEALAARSINQKAVDLRRTLKIVQDRLANQLTLNNSYHSMALERGLIVESIDLAGQLAFGLAIATPEQVDQALRRTASGENGPVILRHLRAGLGRIEAEIAGGEE